MRPYPGLSTTLLSTWSVVTTQVETYHIPYRLTIIMLVVLVSILHLLMKLSHYCQAAAVETYHP